MNDFAFKVNLVASVLVSAADENAARRVVPTVLGAPGAAEIGLANQNNAAVGLDAVILEVDFSSEESRVELVEIYGKPDPNGAGASSTCAPVPATHSQAPRPSYWK